MTLEQELTKKILKDFGSSPDFFGKIRITSLEFKTQFKLEVEFEDEGDRMFDLFASKINDSLVLSAKLDNEYSLLIVSLDKDQTIISAQFFSYDFDSNIPTFLLKFGEKDWITMSLEKLLKFAALTETMVQSGVLFEPCEIPATVKTIFEEALCVD